jgi:putative IMPACT (imprinted ancient) family translation regulator
MKDSVMMASQVALPEDRYLVSTLNGHVLERNQQRIVIAYILLSSAGALEASDVYDCVVLVTRYFGGVKLGTGGLVRAYASAAREALDAANKIEIIPMVEVSISTSSSQIGSIYHALSAVPFTAERLSESFSDDSLLVTVAVRVPAEREADLKAKVTDICKGSATFGAIAGRSDLS